MARIVILGGGISGLLAARVFAKQSPVLLEASPTLGGAYTRGGLKYVRDTPGFRALLQDLRLDFTPYKPRGAVFYNRTLYPHPEWMTNLTPAERTVVQLKHWIKTRGNSNGFSPTCMNDPSGEANDLALWFDHVEFMSRLATAARNEGATLLINATVEAVDDTTITVAGLTRLDYERVITTLPAGTFCKMAGGCSGILADLDAAHRLMTVVALPALPDFLIEAGAERMDYIYTPDLPGVTRFSPAGGGWQAEFPGDAPASDTLIQAVLGVGRAFSKQTIPGHLRPLRAPVTWPENIHPLGRFAQWDSRMTAEKVLSQVTEWERTWRA